MPKFRTKTEDVNAIQFTGDNWAVIQKIAGNHAIDAQGVYVVPNFDVVANWWPANPDPEVTAVLWNNNQWQAVKPTDWLVRADDGTTSVMSDAEFEAKYEVPGV